LRIAVRRMLVLAAGAVTMTTIGALTAAPATAAPDGPDAVATRTTVVSGHAVRAAEPRQRTNAEVAQARDKHLLGQARAGRSVDASATHTAVVDGLEVVWEDGSTIQQISITDVRSTANTDDFAQSVKASVSHDDVATPAQRVATGAGLSGSFGVSGASLISGSCSTFTTVVNDLKLTECWAKYKVTAESSSTSDFYFYDRYATAVGKSTPWYDPFHIVPVKIDIRSRPWSSLASRVTGLVAYQPRSTISSCVSGGSLSISYAGFSASVPISACSHLTPFPNASTKTMQVVWDNFDVFSDVISRGAEFAMVVSSNQGVSPSLADYNYARWCHGPATCSWLEQRDSGW
jgi:hypothetical protein